MDENCPNCGNLSSNGYVCSQCGYVFGSGEVTKQVNDQKRFFKTLRKINEVAGKSFRKVFRLLEE